MGEASELLNDFLKFDHEVHPASAACSVEAVAFILDVEVFRMFVGQVKKYDLKFMHRFVPAFCDGMLGGGQCARIRCKGSGVLTEDIAGNLVSQNGEGEKGF